MAVVTHFIDEAMKKAQIDEFLQTVLEKAGYGGVDITKTPLGTNIVVYAMKPGLVIGRGGETVKSLSRDLEKLFGLSDPQISVAELEIPELNAFVMASRLASALKQGVHFRRSAFWTLNRITEAGALGAEIIISGKLRTDRARHEKFKTGYLPKSGDPAIKNLSRAAIQVKLKPGIFGIKVTILPPNAKFPDRVQIITEPAVQTLPEIDTQKEEGAE